MFRKIAYYGNKVTHYGRKTGANDQCKEFGTAQADLDKMAGWDGAKKISTGAD